MNIQLLKRKFGQRRFIKTALSGDVHDWPLMNVHLKNFIQTKGQLQLVGQKTYLEVKNHELSVMLEVLGLPLIPDEKSVEMLDLISPYVLIYEWKKGNIFDTPLSLVLDWGHKITQTLGNSPHGIHPIFHIVLEEEKIALHFFGQNDYSQNLL